MSRTPGKVRALGAALDELAAEGTLGVSVPFFSPDEVAALIRQASRLPMRKAKPRAGAQGREVHQDFDICFPAPRQDALADLADLLEICVAEVEKDRNSPFLDGPLTLNDLAVQHYASGSKGIGVHRDALRYRRLVFIITLAGESRFCLCADRDGTGATVLDDSPGMLTILSAPGFRGREGEAARPLHFVSGITGGRLSIGLRDDSSLST
ncbi:hypothetical protein AB8880_06715 [Alphaproteobacteria bacterium LSUCC0684]